MKRLLIVLVLLAVAGVGLAFYLGWLHFSAGGQDGNPGAAISVDKDKFQEDKEKVKDKLQNMEDKAKDKQASAKP